MSPVVTAHTSRTGECSVSEPNERRLLTPEEYLAAQASPEFMELKRRFRAFAFPMTVAFLTWYLLFVAPLDLRARLHVDRGLRQHQRRPDLRPAAVRLDVRDHPPLRRAREQEHRPDRRRDARPARAPRVRAAGTAPAPPRGPPVADLLAADAAPSASRRSTSRSSAPSSWSRWSSRSGPAATTRAPPTTTPPAATSAAPRTAWRSPVTTCRPRRSSASPAPSPSTATTASCTRSASWSRGSSRCCWSPS